MKNWQLFLLLLGLNLVSPKSVLAHGANIEYGQSQAVKIRALYDDGTPMAKAQAVIYAPNNPTEPWLKGVTNERGEFSFIPDETMSGNWDVKVRHSGHGKIVSIPIKEGIIASQDKPTIVRGQLLSGKSDLTTLQKLVMAAVGIWGFVGTALFFSRHSDRHPETNNN